MKKLTIIAIFIFLVFASTSVLAKSDKSNKSNQGKKPEKLVVQHGKPDFDSETEDEAEEEDDKEEADDSEDEDTSDSPDSDQDDDDDHLSASQAAHHRNTIRKLEKITQETNDPDLSQEVEEVAQEQEEVAEDVEEAIEEDNGRSSLIKLIIGPDYKNLGQLRKQVVQTRNHIRQLEHLKVKASEADQEAIDSAIQDLQETADSLKEDLDQRSSGFSLFGWLARLLTGYQPPEPGPEPTPTPELSITPSPSVQPTPTTIPSPTEIPTPTTNP